MQKYSERPFVGDEIREKLDKYPELLQELLITRNILTEKEAQLFLNPDYSRQVHDPFLMKDMDRAVSRVLLAIERGERIVIYSDYDCDGIPGGVVLHDFFKLIGYRNFSNYIPHRHEEGYGLNIPAIKKLKEEGAQLLITVDSGITDVKQVVYANTLGLDVIITDHHLPGKKLPPAYAILDPKQKNDTYPNPMICGSGVAFKLAQGILVRDRFGVKEGKEKWLLDMVGLATIADMVPLRGENRAFAYFGLIVLRKSPRLGLGKLCKKMRVNQQHLTEDDIAFMIAPRINAASRMDEPMEAFRLLSTDDEVEAGTYAVRLHALNDQRKGFVASMAKEIKKRIEERGSDERLLVMGDPRWKPALLGLVANSLVEEYKKPVFLWGRDGSGVIKGSCRSDGSVDVVALMNKAHSVFIQSGGHAYAGGFSVIHEKIHLLGEELLSHYPKVKRENEEEEGLMIDRRLSLDDVSWNTYKLIEQLAPFGEGNKKPVFLFPRTRVKTVRQFGKEKNHLELLFENSTGKEISAIGFFKTPEQFSKPLREGKEIDLIATIEKSMFKNYPQLRLRIVDIV